MCLMTLRTASIRRELEEVLTQRRLFSVCNIVLMLSTTILLSCNMSAKPTFSSYSFLLLWGFHVMCVSSTILYEPCGFQSLYFNMFGPLTDGPITDSESYAVIIEAGRNCILVGTRQVIDDLKLTMLFAMLLLSCMIIVTLSWG